MLEYLPYFIIQETNDTFPIQYILLKILVLNL